MYKDMPAGAAALFFIQIFSTLAYSVLYITLVLLAVQALHLPASEANHIMATFVAFNFALHLVGGFLGGRLFSFRALFLIGMILQTIGCLFIATLQLHYFMLGMAIFLVGSGMDLPCINCLIAQLFKPEDKTREYAFLWNYSGMNIGFFIGVTMAGIFQSQQNFNTLFELASITNVIAMVLLLFHWKKLRDIQTPLSTVSKKFARGLAGLLLIAIIIIALQTILKYAVFSTEIILMLGVIMSAVIFALILKTKTLSDKNKMLAYCIFALASLVFYTLYELIPMALTLFLERNVDRHAMGIQIPTAWFLNINTVIIIVGCPLLATITKKLRDAKHDINIPLFFSLGLLLIGAAIIVLPLGIYFANARGFISIGWPITTYTLLALAEIALSPIGYALVAELAPPALRGILMGTWLMISGVAAILSNIFSNLALGPTQAVSPLMSNPYYSKTFLHLGIAGIAMGIILWMLKPTLKKLMGEMIGS